MTQLRRQVCLHNLGRRTISSKHQINKETHTALVYEKKVISENEAPLILYYVPANSVPATVKFCWAQVAMHISTVLFGLPGKVVVKIRPLTLSLEFASNGYFDCLNENLHPASIVSPASRKATENRENSGGYPTIASFALRWQTSPSEVVYIQPIWATTKLCTVASTGHITIGGISRATTVNNLRSTI